MLIAHYHWQVGLVADGRLLAAAAASSDTARGLACSARASRSPPSTPRPTSLRQEDPRVRAGSGRTQGRLPLSGCYCGPQAGSQDASPTSSHSSFPHCLPPAPRLPSCFPIATGRARVTRVVSPPPGVGWRAPRPSPGARGTAALRCAPPRLSLKRLQIQKRFRNAFRLREPEDLG